MTAACWPDPDAELAYFLKDRFAYADQLMKFAFEAVAQARELLGIPEDVFHIFGYHDVTGDDFWHHARKATADGQPGEIILFADGAGEIDALAAAVIAEGIPKERIILEPRPLVSRETPIASPPSLKGAYHDQ